MPHDSGNLQVVDVSGDDTLTTEDIKELKRLAQTARTARWLAVGVIAFVGVLAGGLEIIDRLKH